jgi:flagellar biosynthetic protein FlhB
MDTADRTIPATPRRREAARQQGMMPLSSLPAWLAGVLTAVALAPAWAAVTLPAAADMLRRTLATAGRDVAFDSAAVADLRLFLPTIAVVVASGAAAIAVRVLLDGAAWRPARIAPAWSRIDPLAGMARMFSRSAAAAMVGNGLALAILGAAAAWSLAPVLASADVATVATDPVRLIGIGQRAILPLAAVAAVVAAVQWVIARRRFEVRIRMTPQEHQDEVRSLQADPKVRLMREQGRRSSAAPDSRSAR